MNRKLRNAARRSYFGILERTGLHRLSGAVARPGVLMLHQGRCGSTVLEKLLAQHPALRPFSEILEPYFKRKNPPAPLEDLLLSYRLRAFRRYAIPEIKCLECQHPSIYGLAVNDLVSMATTAGYDRFIYLKRRNFLHIVASAAVARLRGGQWHVSVGGPVEDTRVRLDVENVRTLGKCLPIVDMFDYMEDQHKKIYDALSNKDILKLYYEDDVKNDPTVAYRKICEWLDLEPVPVQVTLQRSVQRPVREVVANWDEIAERLRGTKHAWMLEDTPA